ncbi:Peptidoglycan hydrolase FlgJ [compost metagenome]
MDTRISSGVDTGAYTDLNRLNQFKVGGDNEGNLRKVAQEFESLFLNQMLKAMRSANEVFAEGNFTNSNETKMYQDMHDQQLSVSLAKDKGMGLADVLVRQLSQLKKGSSRPNPFAEVNTSVAKAEKSLPAVDSARDDSRLINQRRLALPGKLTDRLLAGIVPSATPADGQPLAGNDWLPAQVYPAPETKALDTDAFRGRRLAQPPLAPARSAFASAEEFVQTMLPMAEEAAAKIGLDARYLVAQAALETGWGKSIIRQQDGSSSHNLFGIKSHGWDGKSARVLTTEYKGGEAVKEAANFRAYESFQQSFHDYVSFLQNNGRYETALDSTANPERFVKELQRAGYATDPNYARKVAQIAKQMQTYQTIAAAGSVPTS